MMPDLRYTVQLSCIRISDNLPGRPTYLELIDRHYDRIAIYDRMSTYFTSFSVDGFENGTVLHPLELPGILWKQYIQTGRIQLVLTHKSGATVSIFHVDNQWSYHDQYVSQVY